MLLKIILKSSTLQKKNKIKLLLETFTSTGLYQ